MLGWIYWWSIFFSQDVTTPFVFALCVFFVFIVVFSKNETLLSETQTGLLSPSVVLYRPLSNDDKNRC